MGRLDLNDPVRPAARLARSSDLDAIVAVEVAAFEPEDRFPRRAWARLLRRPTALCMVLPRIPDLIVPGIPDSVATIAWLLRRTSRLARMYSLSVHPEARGRGLARLLIAASLPALPRRVDTLGLEVRSDNVAAVGLYCSLGFVESERLPDYYGPRRPGIRMRADRSAVQQALRTRG